MDSITIAISGSGGAGAISTGEILLRVAGNLGYFGILKKTFSPQIRGGEAAAILRLSSRPVSAFDDQIHLLATLDWHNFSRFDDELPISSDTIIIENNEKERPEHLANHPNLIAVDGATIAAAQSSDWVNMVFLGLLSNALGAGQTEVESALQKRLAKYDNETKDAARRALNAGYSQSIPGKLNNLLNDRPSCKDTGRWLATGNQMSALGAIEGGIRFVAAYPITPASDLLESISRHIENVDGHLVQAEDELAAINMAIGAGFGGVPAMTATSGPGMALMSEAMGLAVASETPVVVVNVMRGGPSTGIPTKSEQADLNLALYGLHGDAPHVVLAPNSIEDCYHTTAWAVEISTALQTLVIVLSDQFFGHSMKIFDEPPSTQHQPAFLRYSPPSADTPLPYLRYLDTDSGISPMALPGEPEAMYTADGLEHSQNAVPSPKAKEHQRQLDKRARKLTTFDFGERWADLNGDPDGNPLIICFGSVTSAVTEAADQLSSRGKAAAILSLRILSPLPREKFTALLQQASNLLVVEQNHGGQLVHYLRSLFPMMDFRSLAQPGPKPISPAQVIFAVETINEH